MVGPQRQRTASHAGVATYALEVFEACPDIDYIFVPIGGGSGAAGCGIVRARSVRTPRSSACRPRVPTHSRDRGAGPVRVTAAPKPLRRDRTGTTFDLTFTMLKASLDDVVTLEESELEEGLAAAISYTHNLAEGEGAAALAGGP